VTATVAIEIRRRVAAAPSVWLWRLCMAAALAAVALPGLLVAMPPLLDYPNHYVRIWLLAGGANEAPLSQIYAVDWRAAWTNVGIDLLARLVGPVIGVRALAPLLLAAALALPPLGAVALHRRLFGGWRPWQIGIPVAAFATTLLAGFLNYQIGLGLALLAASFDPWLERRASPAQVLMARLAFATGLLVVHIFALGFYGVLLGGLALGPRLAQLWSRDESRRAALRMAAAAVTVAVPLVAFFLMAPSLPGGGELGPRWEVPTLTYKLGVLGCAFVTYDLRIDALFFAPLVAVVAVALVRRRLGAHQGLLLAAAGLAVLALVAPQWAANTAWVDTRLPIMALLTLLAALNPQPVQGGRAAAVMAGLLLALVVGRAAWIGRIWDLRQADIRSVERALVQVPAGAAVMPLEHRPSWAGKLAAPPGRYFHFGASFFHVYTLTVMERRAFSPLVFTTPGKQPLRVRPAWEDISVPNGGRSPPLAVLMHPPSKSWLKVAPYLSQWRSRFDYALMLNADVGPDVDREVVPPELTLVADEGFARLYKVARQPR
jgi:hypothetical protein